MSEIPDVKDALTKKVAGLPGFAWVGIVVGGAYGYKYIKNKNGSNATSATSTTSDTQLIGESATPQDLPAPTNGDWASQVANHLTLSGYTPLDVSTALANYLSGTSLNSAQENIINSAIHGFGTPPEGVIGAVTSPTQTTDNTIGLNPPTINNHVDAPILVPKSSSPPIENLPFTPSVIVSTPITTPPYVAVKSDANVARNTGDQNSSHLSTPSAPVALTRNTGRGD